MGISNKNIDLAIRYYKTAESDLIPMSEISILTIVFKCFTVLIIFDKNGRNNWR